MSTNKGHTKFPCIHTSEYFIIFSPWQKIYVSIAFNFNEITLILIIKLNSNALFFTSPLDYFIFCSASGFCQFGICGIDSDLSTDHKESMKLRLRTQACVDRVYTYILYLRRHETTAWNSVPHSGATDLLYNNSSGFFFWSIGSARRLIEPFSISIIIYYSFIVRLIFFLIKRGIIYNLK